MLCVVIYDRAAGGQEKRGREEEGEKGEGRKEDCCCCISVLRPFDIFQVISGAVS